MEEEINKLLKMKDMQQLIKKLKISGTLEVMTGLHIGDSNESVQIGGIDSPIVRKIYDNQPYIPGSSLKGKIRCLLEQVRGATEIGNSPEVNSLFGITGKKEKQHAAQDKQHASRIIVRDAYLRKESVEELESSEYTDFPYTEVKFENTINRVSGKANNLRQFERIPAGAKFDIEFIINVWDSDDEKEFTDLLHEGINLLHVDYLGGSGSRGYGQVNILLNPIEVVYQAQKPFTT